MSNPLDDFLSTATGLGMPAPTTILIGLAATYVVYNYCPLIRSIYLPAVRWRGVRYKTKVRLFRTFRFRFDAAHDPGGSVFTTHIGCLRFITWTSANWDRQ